jgi:hypothetical protein
MVALRNCSAGAWLGGRLLAAGAVTALLLGAGAARAGDTGALSTNEAVARSVERQVALDVKDKKAVFAYVFKQLPDKVKVFPTEHYYYFKFYHAGLVYAGNMRFENDLRDQGKLHFAYAIEFGAWLPPGETFHQLFERKDGIALDRVDDWTYRLTYEGKTVEFELNKMEGVKPPPGLIGPDEKYVGPIYDESAVRFFLVYNTRLKLFLYVLDETGPQSDQLVTAQKSDRILIGQRTGFAFYRDHKLNRRILIGVFETNSQVNNYFDGPFDQLPDNFLDGDTFRDMILEVAPYLKGQIDRYGSSFDGETRYMIAPYLHYSTENDLAIFHTCATSRRIPTELYYACFAIDEEAERPALMADRKATPEKPAKKGKKSKKKKK